MCRKSSGSAGYELPFGPGKRWLSHGGFAGKVIGGWQLNTIVTLRGGFPTDIRTNALLSIFNTFNVADRVPDSRWCWITRMSMAT